MGFFFNFHVGKFFFFPPEWMDDGKCWMEEFFGYPDFFVLRFRHGYGWRTCDRYTRAFVFSDFNGMAALQLVAIIAE